MSAIPTLPAVLSVKAASLLSWAWTTVPTSSP